MGSVVGGISGWPSEKVSEKKGFGYLYRRLRLINPDDMSEKRNLMSVVGGLFRVSKGNVAAGRISTREGWVLSSRVCSFVLYRLSLTFEYVGGACIRHKIRTGTVSNNN